MRTNLAPQTQRVLPNPIITKEQKRQEKAKHRALLNYLGESWNKSIQMFGDLTIPGRNIYHHGKWRYLVCTEAEARSEYERVVQRRIQGLLYFENDPDDLLPSQNLVLLAKNLRDLYSKYDRGTLITRGFACEMSEEIDGETYYIYPLGPTS